MAGGDLYILKEILGHKSITMTQRYAHLSPTYKIKAIDRMNTLWAGTTPQTSTSELLLENSSVTAASQATHQDPPPADQVPKGRASGHIKRMVTQRMAPSPGHNQLIHLSYATQHV